MCDVLSLPKSTYYYHVNLREKEVHETEEAELSKEIQRIFKESRNNYGTRKIKKELEKLKEFDNQLISDALKTFGIQRSLSAKGCPYDNVVAEATFKIFKTEFTNQMTFTSLAIGNVIINNSVAVEGIHLCISLDKDKGRYYLKCTADQYNKINRLDQEIRDEIIQEFVTKHVYS